MNLAFENLTAKAEWDVFGESKEYEIQFDAKAIAVNQGKDSGGPSHRFEFKNITTETVSGALITPSQHIIDKFKDSMEEVVNKRLDNYHEVHARIEKKAKASRHAESSLSP